MHARMKRLAALGLMAAMTSGTLLGCADKGNNTAQAPATASETPSAKVNGTFSPPVTITTVAAVGEDVKFKNGETYDNNVHTKWARDTLGIDIKYLWAVKTVDDYHNK